MTLKDVYVYKHWSTEAVYVHTSILTSPYGYGIYKRPDGKLTGWGAIVNIPKRNVPNWIIESNKIYKCKYDTETRRLF